ncbi:cell division protein ZapA [Phaeovibrio sulfidiphilus]|uniref:Cell division protein ZapA n=1 Tax=Phaeovibrio sulfidiphilus TaxID=1220600 RepID=A0A8J6YWP9_9PROT|nr:cell division protein ZapA [Phaeovibrio sulfidiphilus]MBE1236068.1 cell division protein ZapA [Phaeovibrio sulfidiphilus]
MPTLPIQINGKTYRIACEDGQEEHLVRLGQYVDHRCRQLLSSVGHVHENLMFVMVSLLIADELSDVSAELHDLRKALGAGPDEDGDGPSARELAEEKLARVIERLTSRIEGIAEGLERT